jgi:hypothetical protein
MAKRGRKPTNAPYKKISTQCANELKEKKAALVRAEKALAKAQKTHTELLSEVARLDMLDRSLKALINGLEPPQNVKYVYTYPQWVWYPNGTGWWYQTSPTITLSAPTITTTGSLGTTSNWQGGLFSNTPNLQGGQFTSQSQNYNNSVNLSSSNGTMTFNTTTVPATSGVTLTSTATAPTWTTVNTAGSAEPVNNYSFTYNPTPGEQVIDLSTGAADPATEPVVEKVQEVVEEEFDLASVFSPEEK